MRGVVLSVVAAGVLLAGCGASTSSIPVESGTASGAPAAVEDCPSLPPARGGLNGHWTAYEDGVVGAIYNRTGSPIFVRGLIQEIPCRLASGERVAYAGAHLVDEIEYAKGEGPSAPWFPSGGNADFGGVDFAILVTSGPDRDGPGIAIGLEDPLMGRPSVSTVYRTYGGAECPTAKGALDTGGLSEGTTYVLKGPAPGEVKVTRLKDDKVAAREWVGVDQSNVDDWARIDLEIVSLGSC